MLQKDSAYNSLRKLSGSGFEIVDGQPDIRGWDVKDANGKRMGEVDELLFDEDSRKVRYLVLDLSGNVFDLDTRDVLVPIGLAQLHEKDDDVILNGVTAEQLRALPEYDHDRFNNEQELKVREVFAGSTGLLMPAESRDAGFYTHEHYSDTELYRNRRSAGDTPASGSGNEAAAGRPDEEGGIRLRSSAEGTEVPGSMKERLPASNTGTVNMENTPEEGRSASRNELRDDQGSSNDDPGRDRGTDDEAGQPGRNPGVY